MSLGLVVIIEGWYGYESPAACASSFIKSVGEHLAWNLTESRQPPKRSTWVQDVSAGASSGGCSCFLALGGSC